GTVNRLGLPGDGETNGPMPLPDVTRKILASHNTRATRPGVDREEDRLRISICHRVPRGGDFFHVTLAQASFGRTGPVDLLMARLKPPVEDIDEPLSRRHQPLGDLDLFLERITDVP